MHQVEPRDEDAFTLDLMYSFHQCMLILLTLGVQAECLGGFD